MKNVNGEAGVEGRGNIAPVTINLPRIGIRAMLFADQYLREELKEGKVCKYSDEYISITTKKFKEYFKEEILIARKSLLHRYNVLKNLKVKDLPFVAGQGLMKGSEGLSPNDSIEPIMKQGTWGIGFIGLSETLVALLGEHHGQGERAQNLGLEIVGTLRNYCDSFCEIDKLNYSCYATPAEGLSGRFAPMDRAKFGVIQGVNDKDYYTNSYHIPVEYNISIGNKIKLEAPYHSLCNAGHISYIEVDNYPTGLEIMDIIKYAYTSSDISYIGVNFHIRYCKDCGTYLHGEDNCPRCGGHNIQGVSRVTGYLSLDERFGVGKSAERSDRTSHTNGRKHFYKV